MAQKKVKKAASSKGTQQLPPHITWLVALFTVLSLVFAATAWYYYG